MIFIVDSDRVMADCLARACEGFEVRKFEDVYAVMGEINEGTVPDLILMDVMLAGVDGFSLLNELTTYNDTARIPVVIVSMVDFGGRDLSDYGVVGVLNKETMTPAEVRWYAEKYCGGHEGIDVQEVH